MIKSAVFHHFRFCENELLKVSDIVNPTHDACHLLVTFVSTYCLFLQQ